MSDTEAARQQELDEFAPETDDAEGYGLAYDEDEIPPEDMLDPAAVGQAPEIEGKTHVVPVTILLPDKRLEEIRGMDVYNDLAEVLAASPATAGDIERNGWTLDMLILGTMFGTALQVLA